MQICKPIIKFDEGTGNVINDASAAGNDATMFSMTWRNRGGKELFRNFLVSNDRPNTTFVKGGVYYLHPNHPCFGFSIYCYEYCNSLHSGQ
jgi:hypothetical protein